MKIKNLITIGIISLLLLIISNATFSQSGNTFYGENAGINTTGNNNSFFGHNAGYQNTTGTANVFMGYYSGVSNDIGGANVAIGYRSLLSSESGKWNTTIGTYSMENLETGDGNVGMGYLALRNLNTGYRNVAVGSFAGKNLDNGDYNTFLGYGTGTQNTTGSGNVFIGHEAGRNELGSDKFYLATSYIDTKLLLYGDFTTQQLAIGTKNIPTNILTSQGESYALFVPRGILTDEVKVKTGWADYVFEKSFELPSIEEEIAFIDKNGHLMSFPSAKEIDEDGGVNVGEMMVKQQEMIEKLMLYVAELKGEIEGMKK